MLVMVSCKAISLGPSANQAPATAEVTTVLATHTSVVASPTFESESPTATMEAVATQQQETSLKTPEDCNANVCLLDGSFLLKVPIGDENRNVIDTANRYGTLRRRKSDTYRGVQFLNSAGTPVYAAAAGDVVVAGNDSEVSYGPPLDTYGNLVIIKHSLPGISVPVYTLYAHLSKVSVKAEGDVKAGQQIGLVGSSGSVRGSTLYFEVRYGENSYTATRNPELWLEPLVNDSGAPMGALAGQVIDKQGNFVDVKNILLENLRTTSQGTLRPIYLKTYLDDDLSGQNPWDENFAAGYLPEGTYQIAFWYGPNRYQREVEVQPGKLTYVTFEVK